MRLSIAINPAMPVTMETPQRESLLVVMVTMQRTLRVLHCVLRKVRWEGIGVHECLCVCGRTARELVSYLFALSENQ